MIKKLVGIFICALLIFTILPVSADMRVNRSYNSTNFGNTLYVGGSGLNNYTKIQDAIDDAEIGDTVFVYDDNSPYYEKIWINKSIYLNGENRNTTIIEEDDDNYVIVITSDNVTIYNFTIQNKGYGDDIFISNSDECNIINNHIISNNKNIIIEDSINISIQANTIESKWESHGVPSWAPCVVIHSNQNSIINNTIYHISKSSFSGIKISGSGNMIMGNILYDNLEGISGFSCEDNMILKNTIHSSCDGIALYGSTNNIITGNYITRNEDGIYLGYKSNQNYIIDNSIISNYQNGIKLDDECEKNWLWRNIIKENNYGMFIHDDCNNNTIICNSFLNNENQSYDDCDNNWNDPYPLSGNYWSDYIGKDDYHGYNQDISGSDGIGDTPYNISNRLNQKISNKLNQDKYPFIYPYDWPFQPIYLGLSEFYFGKTKLGRGYELGWHSVLIGKYLNVNTSLDELSLKIVLYFTVEMNYTMLLPFALSPLIAFGMQIVNYSDYSWNAMKLKHHGHWIWYKNISQEIIINPKDFKKGDELILYVNISYIHVPGLKSPGNTKLWEKILRIAYNMPMINKFLLCNRLLPYLAPYNIVTELIPAIVLRFQ